MEQLDPEEIRELQKYQAIYEMSCTAGWKAYMLPQMQAWAEEAHEDMLGAQYGSPEVRSGLMGRWQQRETVVRAVEAYVSECNAARLRIKEDIEERQKMYAGVPSEEI